MFFAFIFALLLAPASLVEAVAVPAANHKSEFTRGIRVVDGTTLSLSTETVLSSKNQVQCFASHSQLNVSVDLLRKVANNMRQTADNDDEYYHDFQFLAIPTAPQTVTYDPWNISDVL